MSLIRSAAGSTPTDSRMRPSGAVSPGHLARGSQVDSTPPKLVAGRIRREPPTTVSAALAGSLAAISKDSRGPQPAGICRPTTSASAVPRPG